MPVDAQYIILQYEVDIFAIDDLPRDIQLGFAREDVAVIRAWLAEKDSRWQDAKDLTFKTIPCWDGVNPMFCFEGLIDAS